MQDDDYDGNGGPFHPLIIFVCALMWAAGIIIAAWLLVGTGWAHEWYPLRCCSGTDCSSVRAQNVKEGPNGYEVIVRPGEHPMVTKETLTFLVPYKQAESSPDNEYHICINGTGKLLCFFAGARSF